MLPLSCLRCADSKSNSSTRLPRKTTTRVSSGWVASMSILLAIGKSHTGWRAASSRPDRRGLRALRPIAGVGNGSGTPSAAKWREPRTSVCRSNAAAPFRSDLDLRLEHELQTAVERRHGRRVVSIVLTTIGGRVSGSVHRCWRAVRVSSSGCSFLRASALCVHPARIVASKAGSASWLPYGAFSRGRAGCPDRTQSEP
jgi:hypothetical protein